MEAKKSAVKALMRKKHAGLRPRTDYEPVRNFGLIRRAELPMPAAERRAELAALRTSNDQLAAIAADLSLFVSALSRPGLAALAPLRQRMLNLDADIVRHLQVAAALLARMD
jgi:hypothetical protein